jgi:hypothetical protein
LRPLYLQPVPVSSIAAASRSRTDKSALA